MTYEELSLSAQSIKDRLEHLRKFLSIEENQEEKERIETVMSAPDFWDSREKSQEVISKLQACKNILEPFDEAWKEFEDLQVVVEFSGEDESLIEEGEKGVAEFGKKLDQLELVSFLSGKFDHNNCFFIIHAGAGGTESCDWTSILMRMYRRYFERRGWKDEVVDIQLGEEAGIKSVTLRVEGNFAFGYLKAENGVHRLVRISPFDSNARRHTSFSSVDVLPELNDDIEVPIEEKDLKIDTYRASGAGGQHVNTTDSAVRITHIPTGIIVACQMERSQHKNKATALRMLQAKIYEKEETERAKEANEIRGEKSDIAFGSQIRSYVLHPYQLVKDLRTDVETGNTAAVLDGDLDRFIEAWLRSAGGSI